MLSVCLLVHTFTCSIQEEESGAASQIPSVTLALVIHMFNRVYVSASWEGGLCVHMHASAYRGWKKTLDPLELELTRLQAVVSHPT